ncbi:Rab family GTPase [Phormidium sp. CCY1219]|jgi:small GTP-binding protein|uniref:Rab family GTPase n=1 Tax=Phormidium sp. CCY1219 TaxID=2886104 RepID=UPI002D1E8DF7|nr:Rab family GTPase [Phormidium sp. CCY1219]MEB3828144.1 GTP-binding protein [Phormidium sp. CCY1219]
MAAISKKMCMIGDFGVGKTSLIRRFIEREFSDQYLSTVGVKISRKTVEVERVNTTEIVTVQLLIWDLEGHTKFKAIAPSYLQGASGALVVADLTRQETLERLPEHIKLFSSVNAKGSVIVALNKSDLVEEDKIAKLNDLSKEVIDSLPTAKERVLATYSTSAKTGVHVDEIFHELAARMIR